MATLTVTVLDVEGNGRAGQGVIATLTDADGVKVLGYDAAGQVVREVKARTDPDGVATLDLIPNADLTPANTYYTVRVADFAVLIEKGAGAETLEDALAADPDPLGTTLLAAHQAASPAHAAGAISSATADGTDVEAILDRWTLGKAEDNDLALRNRHNDVGDPAVVVLIGDSVTQGRSVDTFLGSTSWANLLAERLSAQYGGLPRGTWVPMRAYAGVATSGFDTMTGEDYAANTDVNNYTAAGHGALLETGELAEHAAVGSSVIVHYCKVNGGDDLEVYVNDVLEATVSTHDAAAANPQTGYSVEVEPSVASADSTLTVRVQPAGAGPVYVDGAYFAVEGEQVRVYNLAHGGWAFETYTTLTATADFVTAVDPCLLIDALGLNNRANALATWTTRHAADLAAWQAAAPNAGILYVAPYYVTFAPSFDDADDYDAKVAACRANCIDAGVAFLDIGRTIAGPGSGLLADGLHPNAAGHRAFADRVLAELNSVPDAAALLERVRVPVPQLALSAFGLYASPPHTSRSTASFADGDLIGVPVVVQPDWDTIVALGIELTAAAVGTADAYLGLYNLAGQLIAELGTVDLTGATGALTVTPATPITLPDAALVLAVGFEGANVAGATLRTMVGGLAVGQSAANAVGASIPNGIVGTGTVSGGLPQALGWATTATAAPPLIIYRGV